MGITCIIVLVFILEVQTTYGQMMVMPGPMSPFASSMTFNPRARNGGYDNFMGVHGSNYQRRSREEAIFTAIGYDDLDHSSQMRVTIREKSSNFPGSPYSGSWDTPLTWYIHGTFLNSDVMNKAGTYYLVVTETGRTRDGCDSASLGRVIGSNRMGSQRFDKFHLPVGVLPDRLTLTSKGPTVFASKLEGVSRSQLGGAGIAACQYVRNGYCSGAIQFCGTISKDNLPAMEVPKAVRNNQMESSVDSLLDFGASNGFGASNNFGAFNGVGSSQGLNDQTDSLLF